MTAISPYRKRQETLIIGYEPTPGTTATKQYSFRWKDSKGIRSIPGIVENDSSMGSGIKVNDSAIDVWHSEGTTGGKVTEDSLGYLIGNMLNKVTTTGSAAPYTHTFTRDQTVARRSSSIWDVRPQGTRLYNSCYFDNLDLSLEVTDKGAWFESKLSSKGWKHQDITAGTVTPAFIQGEKEFTSRQVQVYLADTVANLTTGKIKPRKITLSFNEAVTVDHSIGEVNNDPEFTFAPQEVKGTMTIKYRSTDLETDYFNNAVHAMKIVATNGSSSITILGTKVRFRELKDSENANDTVTQDISFYFESDDTNGGQDVQVTIVNGITNYNA